MKARKEIDDIAVKLRNYHHTAVAKNQSRAIRLHVYMSKKV
jgi:hypothetical protein